MFNKNLDLWQLFFDETVKKIFTEKKLIIDIGGGLRILKEKNNRYEPSHEWIRSYLKNVDYKILDPVDTFNPDIVGDIHSLPLEDNSVDAIICLSVLEHVKNPILATQEIYRVLKPGGYCFIYVPFLYYYHAEEGYYGDYWRFTKDTMEMLAEPFSSKKIGSVFGAIESWIKITPLGHIRFVRKIANILDKVTGKVHSNQVSGYNMFLVK